MEFQSFDSFEDMMAALQQSEAAADQSTCEWQTRIKVGDLVARHDPDCDLWIYTEILDPLEGERKLCDMSDPCDQEHMESLELQWAPGGPKRYRRWGRHYSQACPEGELGELHVCTVTAIIPRYVFDAAVKGGVLISEGQVVAEPIWDFPPLARKFQAIITEYSHGFTGE